MTIDQIECRVDEPYDDGPAMFRIRIENFLKRLEAALEESKHGVAV